MREALLTRQAGVSSAVALMTVLEKDRDWDLIFARLLAAARLEKSLKRFRRR